MKVIDVNGKERDVASIKRMSQQIPDVVNGGIAAAKEYVEVEIIGRTGRRWKEWYPLEDFRKQNPDVVVK